MSNVELGIQGEFPRKEAAKKRCPDHPGCLIGQCGGYLGMPHSWTPNKIEPVAIQSMFNENLIVGNVYVYGNGETDITHKLRSSEVRNA